MYKNGTWCVQCSCENSKEGATKTSAILMHRCNSKEGAQAYIAIENKSLESTGTDMSKHIMSIYQWNFDTNSWDLRS